jgi:inhibitor of cysteine peptidase
MPRSRSPLIAALSLIVLALCSCAVAGSEEKAVTVTEKDQGHTVQVGRGDTLIVRLAAQLGTGYGWHVSKNDARILQSLGEPSLERQGEGKPGGVETQVFRFRAAASGKSALTLAYSRPWEKDRPPTKTYGITVEVH